MPRQVPLGSGCQRVQESIGKFNALLVGVFEYFLYQILVLDFVFGSVAVESPGFMRSKLFRFDASEARMCVKL